MGWPKWICCRRNVWHDEAAKHDAADQRWWWRQWQRVRDDDDVRPCAEHLYFIATFPSTNHESSTSLYHNRRLRYLVLSYICALHSIYGPIPPAPPSTFLYLAYLQTPHSRSALIPALLESHILLPTMYHLPYDVTFLSFTLNNEDIHNMLSRCSRTSFCMISYEICLPAALLPFRIPYLPILDWWSNRSIQSFTSRLLRTVRTFFFAFAIFCCSFIRSFVDRSGCRGCTLRHRFDFFPFFRRGKKEVGERQVWIVLSYFESARPCPDTIIIPMDHYYNNT